MAFELGRQLEMPWVPRLEPVELVVNDEYLGFYYLCETVRIHENRVNIFEQPDLNENPDDLDGGWLIEIDNYVDDNQIVLTEKPGMEIKFTIHSPEELSSLQYDYIYNALTELNDAIYSGDESGQTWANLIDPSSVVKYFLAREIMHDTDGYNGSFYFHKDLGEKWQFGPLWDTACNNYMVDWIMYDNVATNSPVHWIEPLFHTDIFQKTLVEEFEAVKPRLQNVYDYGWNLMERVERADTANYLRWPDIFTDDPRFKYSWVLSVMRQNAEWIDSCIHGNALNDDASTEYYTIQGYRVDAANLRRGQLYIRRTPTATTKFLQR